MIVVLRSERVFRTFFFNVDCVIVSFIQVRRLEGQGVPSKQAEAITAVITEVLNDSMDNAANSYISKSEIHKVRIYLARL